MERFDLYNVGMIVHGIARAATLLILLKLGYSVLPLAVSTVGLAVLFLGVHFLLVKWADPELHLSAKNLSWQRTKEMCNFGFYSFVNNSGETLRYYTDSFVIGRMLSVALVTPFSVATRLTEYFKMLVGGISGPIMVRLSSLSGQGDDKELKQEFLRATRFSMLLSVFVGGLFIIDGKMLISLWMGPDLLSSYPILLALTVAYIITWGQIPCPMLLFARARHHKAISWWTLVEGISNLILSILWAPKLGLLGVALGTAVPLTISKLLIQPYYVLKDLGINAVTYFLGGLSRALLVAAIFFSVSWYLVQNYAQSTSYFSLAIICIWQTAFFLVLSLALGMARADRTTVRAAAKDFAMSLGMARRM
jgi:O-antigen/teichoic acid export membrane protein